MSLFACLNRIVHVLWVFIVYCHIPIQRNAVFSLEWDFEPHGCHVNFLDKDWEDIRKMPEYPTLQKDFRRTTWVLFDIHRFNQIESTCCYPAKQTFSQNIWTSLRCVQVTLVHMGVTTGAHQHTFTHIPVEHYTFLSSLWKVYITLQKNKLNHVYLDLKNLLNMSA